MRSYNGCMPQLKRTVLGHFDAMVDERVQADARMAEQIQLKIVLEGQIAKAHQEHDIVSLQSCTAKVMLAYTA